MSINADGKTIATTENGFVENPEDWTAPVAKAMAQTPGYSNQR